MKAGFAVTYRIGRDVPLCIVSLTWLPIRVFFTGGLFLQVSFVACHSFIITRNSMHLILDFSLRPCTLCVVQFRDPGVATVGGQTEGRPHLEIRQITTEEF